MTEQILSFEEILEQEEYVLIDTSFSCSPENSGWFKEGVYGTNSYSEINAEILRSQIRGLTSFSSVLGRPNVYTSRGVSIELMRGRDLVERKINKLDYLTRRKRSKIRNRNGGKVKGDDQREFMKDIRDLFFQSSHKARESILKPEQRELYAYLENLVLKVSVNTNSKQDFSPRYRGFNEKEKEDFHTDEQLVSLALYLSVQGNGSCMASRDSDLRRILMNTLRYVSDRKSNYCTYPNPFLRAIEKNGIRIFYPSSLGEGRISFDTSDFRVESRLPPKEVSKINQALAA